MHLVDLNVTDPGCRTAARLGQWFVQPDSVAPREAGRLDVSGQAEMNFINLSNTALRRMPSEVACEAGVPGFRPGWRPI